jgi:tRNA-modifying protein YgfZ
MNTVTILDRELSYQRDLPDELHGKEDTLYLCPLPHLSCISICGEKSLDFLQGQLSSDLRKVSADRVEHAALCNIKGRIRALVDILLCHDYQLVTPLDIIPIIQKDLKTVAMLSKIELHVSQRYLVFGLIGPSDHPTLEPAFQLDAARTVRLDHQSITYRLSPSLSILIIDKTLEQQLTAPFLKHNQLRGSLAWHYQYLKAGFFTIYPETAGQFLPHKVSLQDKGFLDFDKGCYKGQEVIARMHYKATIKHRLKHYTLSSDTAIVPGQPLVGEDGKNIGEVVDVCPLAESQYYIVASVLKSFSGVPLVDY